MSLPPGLPVAVPQPGLPSQVRILEVGPRDGLQNEARPLPTEIKLEFIRRLVAAGMTAIEATSFVHPERVPQLADSDVLFPRLPATPGVAYSALVPNAAGLDRALAAGVRRIAIFGSATETFARANLGRSVAEQFAMFAPVVDRAKAAGLHVRAYLSMCFGDPWEGPVPRRQVVDTGRRLLDLGADELCLGDTIGVATAGQTGELIEDLLAAGVPVEALAVHFHDTYGQALTNTFAALRLGVTAVDASAGGLGGCPFAKSATGNLATEDLVFLLSGLGITHGVDLTALVQTSVWMAGLLGRPSPSAVVRALASPPADGLR